MSQQKGVEMNSKPQSSSQNRMNAKNDEERMRMVQSGVHQFKMCIRCQQLDQILQQKDLYIQELRSYQKLLSSQMQPPLETQEESQILRKQIYDMEMRELKLKKMLDQLQNEIIQKNSKVHDLSETNNQLSQTNIELRRQVLDLEAKIILQDDSHLKFVSSVKQMVISCHPENYFKPNEPNLKQMWKWLKSVLQDYMILKQKSNNSLEYSSQKKQAQ